MMNIKLEKTVKYYNNDNYKQTLLEYAETLQLILSATNEKDLRNTFSLVELNNFEHGFGSNHLWIAQMDREGNAMDRCIIVTF